MSSEQTPDQPVVSSEQTMQPEQPTSGGQEVAPAEAGGAAKPAADPRKGLPPIAKPTVIRSDEPAPRRGLGGGRPERGPRGDRKPMDLGEKVPDTRSTLQAVSDESGGLSAEMAAEINAAMESGTPHQARPAHPDKPRVMHTAGEPARVRGPRVVQSGREHRPGTVVSVGPTDVFLEFGPKELAVVPRTQWKEGEEPPAVGSTLDVVVDKFDTTENLFLCSRPGTVTKAAWENLEVGQTVEARVTGHNKGGLELEVAGHRAFMPAGQVSLERIPDLSVLVGEKFACQVIQLDTRGAGNIVLGRKDLLKQEREEKAKKLKETLAEGQTIEGTVRKIMPFGAFVDLGGLDGLLHLSDMTYDRVFPGEKNVEKYVKDGARVRVKILKLDLEANRISLGMKQLMDDPFSVAVNQITEGAEVMGRVVRMTEFGAFLEIAPGVDGLVHISEISRRRIAQPGDVLKQDEVVKAKVLKIDPGTRKISLSIKQLLPVEPPAPGSREAMMAEKNAERAKRDAERLAEIAKETPALRREREKFKNKQLSGGFGEKAKFLGGGLGDLKL
ncbi:MAG: S1 RNA-binding domain-containing protein [Phycisphaerales bacterium]